MIQMYLLSVQIQWMTFIRILKTTRKRRILIAFNDMIADINYDK